MVEFWNPCLCKSVFFHSILHLKHTYTDTRTSGDQDASQTCDPCKLDVYNVLCVHNIMYTHDDVMIKNNKDEFVLSIKHADQPEVCKYME